MGHNDFKLWEKGDSYHKVKKHIPRIKLDDITVVQFRKDSRNMFVKTFYISEYKEIDFLKDSFELKEAVSRNSPRGVETRKKSDIIEKLCPLMPENRRIFEANLPSSDRSQDLIINFN